MQIFSANFKGGDITIARSAHYGQLLVCAGTILKRGAPVLLEYRHFQVRRELCPRIVSRK
jgi:hypothetical protein